MQVAFSLSIQSPILFSIAGVLAIASLAIVAVRRLAFPVATHVFLGVAAICLALAAGKIAWEQTLAQRVDVLVDLSPSTRGAAYRDRATLDRRLKQLLGSTPYQVHYFADATLHDAAGGDTRLEDIPADQTVFAPPAGAPVVLFSDGRFPLPQASPAVYPAIDPLLDEVNDAAITRMQLRGRMVDIHVRNSLSEGPAVAIELDGVEGAAREIIPPGNWLLQRQISAGAGSVVARLTSHDRWPENDTLSIPVPPGQSRLKWWVSDTAPPPDNSWTAIPPAKLPTDSAAYLSPTVIALANVSAEAIPQPAMQRLEQYVRDLSGALLILGGDHAFASGSYEGTPLETLSPLASSPPEPTTHWILLVDSSGSMSDEVSPGQTKWQAASSALVNLLPALPPEDVASVGSFSDGLRWWSAGKSVKETAALSLPPASVTPNGPTNLESVLQALAANVPGDLPKQLLLLTDAEVTFEHPDAVVAALNAHKIHFHLLAIAPGEGLAVLQRITHDTGGSLIEMNLPKDWAAGVRELSRAALPPRWIASPIQPTGLAAPAGSLAAFNRTWAKKNADTLSDGPYNGQAVPLVAQWQIGGGQVLSAAFAAPAGLASALSDRIARPPGDPRLRVTLDADATLTATIDAFDGGHPMNGLRFSLALQPADASSPPENFSMPQTAPGEYQLALPSPRAASLAMVYRENQLLHTAALPARYAPEFAELGNDYDNLRALAKQTGGEVIPPNQVTPIHFPWPRRQTSLAPLFALLAAACLAIALAFWRLA